MPRLIPAWLGLVVFGVTCAPAATQGPQEPRAGGLYDQLVDAVREHDAIRFSSLAQDATSDQVNQLLLVAVERCDPSIVRILLAKGASPDYGVGGAAETPLLNAARVGCPEVAMQLLKAGATAAGRAGSAGYDADLPLYTAIQYGHSRVAYLLFPPRTDPNARSRRGTGGELGGVNAGPTLLMEAARQGAVVLAEALLDNGADARLRDGKGQQAIDYLGEHQRQVGQLAARLKPLPPK